MKTERMKYYVNIYLDTENDTLVLGGKRYTSEALAKAVIIDWPEIKRKYIKTVMLELDKGEQYV